MARALELAESGLYVPTPNPRVGCVIVKDGQMVAEGVTQAAGHAHAEVMALRDLKQKGGSAEGATVYVSLEPCSHHGKTPPCTDALIHAKPARVVIAHVDPYPAVSGRGIAALRSAGIAVSVGVLAKEALEINPGFVSRMVRGKPYVWAKIAASMDRFTALPDGQSQWITGAEARADGHHWRARSCLVLTGIGTVKADNPLLNVRAIETHRQPRRAVIDPKLEIPDNAKLLQTEGLILFAANPDEGRVTQLTSKEAVVVNVPDQNNPDRVDMNAVMQWLAEYDINEVHVEAGAGINGALWRAGCIDELILYLAPTFLGHGLPMLDIPGIDQLSEADQLSFIDHDNVGQDIRIRARKFDRWQELVEHIESSNAQHAL
ncbi:bifunctional diaminohydroxyphosphoribosylaminopyrimidine deaminase/5-amino-6-(5-phosphoribosylamino)uracil reductase RibD [Orrella daihaiensis]|uniref:Riboflavin biosynthesis protein RibD n=2 Tax=Orrella daihaiensis TaxID=2782176 RepID=A0ABY4ANY3_9BURK|nr:bifunctional diaminohydroxyphosphoribosylaminopyrimidine deaminase/5-amino-6-(5-phosphoribosylamino)uracil reductase RibD [Orrella daihaiensis]